MPFRKQSARPPEFVTLDQALNWIAYDDISGPPLSLQEATVRMFGEPDNVEALDIEYFVRQQSLDAAKEDLFSALSGGEIKGKGCFSDTSKQTPSRSDWMGLEYIHDTETQTTITSEFWHLEGIDWESSRAKSPDGEYANIVLKWRDVTRLWPLEEQNGEEISEEKAQVRKGRKRGRKKDYDDLEFFALSIWEANSENMPAKRSEFIERMARLLEIVWPNGKVPGDTWLKEKVGYIYSLEEKYERGRQAREEAQISDAD